MRVLYGVVGEGMGHAVRSRVILDHLIEEGHELLIVASGRAYAFMEGRYAGKEKVQLEKIHGLHLKYEGNTMELRGSIRSNVKELPVNLRTNARAYRRIAGTEFQPQVVISDFEYWAYLYGRRHRVPIISVDNMKILDRCLHDPEVVDDGRTLEFEIARLAVQVKVANAYHYLISTFFYPTIRKARTTLVPPILRPEVLALKREPGDHVLVYQTQASNEALVQLLRTLPYSFRVYGLRRDEQLGNVRLCDFSETRFLEDLRTARGVIAGGGFSLMSEAVHLGVPMLSVPLEGQFEQGLNARYLAQLGYGAFTRRLEASNIAAFLSRLPEYEMALATYPRQDNSFTFHCLDELLWHIRRGDPAPPSLSKAAIFAASRRN